MMVDLIRFTCGTRCGWLGVAGAQARPFRAYLTPCAACARNHTTTTAPRSCAPTGADIAGLQLSGCSPPSSCFKGLLDVDKLAVMGHSCGGATAAAAVAAHGGAGARARARARVCVCVCVCVAGAGGVAAACWRAQACTAALPAGTHSQQALRLLLAPRHTQRPASHTRARAQCSRRVWRWTRGGRCCRPTAARSRAGRRAGPCWCWARRCVCVCVRLWCVRACVCVCFGGGWC
jgi:hypothetical protein